MTNRRNFLFGAGAVHISDVISLISYKKVIGIDAPRDEPE